MAWQNGKLIHCQIVETNFTDHISGTVSTKQQVVDMWNHRGKLPNKLNLIWKYLLLS